LQNYSLEVDLSIPITEPTMPDLDYESIFKLLEERPMRETWVASLPERLRTRKFLDAEGGFDRWGRQYQIEHAIDLSRTRELLGAGNWSSADVTSMATASSNPSDGIWFYKVSISFVTNSDTGEYMARWGGLSSDVDSPTLPESFTESWADEVWDFMLRGTDLLGALYGYARVHRRDQRDFAKAYLYRYYGLPPRDPDDIPGAQWVCLIPPRALEKLGGWGRLSTEAPVHRSSAIHYRDGRVGALLQATPLPQTYDEVADQVLRSYLSPILRPW